MQSKFSLVLFGKDYAELLRQPVWLVPQHEPPPPSQYLTNAEDIELVWRWTSLAEVRAWNQKLYVTQDFGGHEAVYEAMLTFTRPASWPGAGEARTMVPKGMLLVDPTAPLSSRPSPAAKGRRP